MEKQILATLFLLFTVFSFILFVDLSTFDTLALGGLSTVFATAVLMDMEGGVE